MGTGVSKHHELEHNELLAQLADTGHIPPTDPYWQRLLAFHLMPPISNEEQMSFDSATDNLLQKLLTNSPTSGNIGSLIRVFITRATDLLSTPNADNDILSWQTFNALFVVRCIAKYLVENVNEQVLQQHFHTCWDAEMIASNPSVSDQNNVTQSMDKINGNKSATDLPNTTKEGVIIEVCDTQENHQLVSAANSVEPQKEKTCDNTSTLSCQDGLLEMLIDALLGLIIDVPVTDNTYHLHLEAINTLLVLLSVHLFTPTQELNYDNSLIYKTIFGGRYSLHAGLVIRALLRDVAALRPPPPPAPSGSIVLGLATSIWSMVWGTRWSNDPTMVAKASLGEGTSHRYTHPAASQACLLALALSNHCAPTPTANLYKEALYNCQDIQQAGALGVDFGSLYAALGQSAAAEHVTLLLYLLLHKNLAFRSHLLAHTGFHTLVVPITKTLYDAASSSSHHIYMSLIVLLILTEDDNFNRSIHEITLKNISWYTERAMAEISLGGLLILVIIRTIQYNMLKMRDKYLHTNCLAALANMSSEFRNLHPYVAQRLVSLFETLSRKHTRLEARAHLPVPSSPPTDSSGSLHVEIEQAEEVLTDQMRDELLQDMAVVEEVLRMVLEIINSCLASQLRTNVHLVYTLLHKRALFHRYRTHTAFQDLIQNIEMVSYLRQKADLIFRGSFQVIGYFSARLQRAQEQKGSLGAIEVLAVVTRAADHWSTDRLRKFPELKFRYVEEEQPEEFFTPYVWTLVCSQGAVCWSNETSLRIIREMGCL